MIRAASLMDLSVEFPVDYTVELDCADELFQETVEKVATFVSKVYAHFPRLDNEGREALRVLNVDLNPQFRSVSRESCDQFEAELKHTITGLLNHCHQCVFQHITFFKEIRLSTDYVPQDLLYEICRPFFKADDLGIIFPYKTCSKIILNDEKTKISLSIRFSGRFRRNNYS